MAKTASFAQVLATRLKDALKALTNGALGRVPERKVIVGVTAQGAFVGGQTADGFLVQARDILADSGRVYRWGDLLYLELQDGPLPCLRLLANEHMAEASASSFLANLFCLETRSDKDVKQAMPGAQLTRTLLADAELWGRLPRLQHYARRPVFDADFMLCQPGWNPDAGILVHADYVTSALTEPWSIEPAPAKNVLEQLPSALRALLGGFCWRADADLVNVVGLFLTGLLINHFVDQPHPPVLIDGNQRGLGKTLLGQVLGQVLDGVEPPRIPLVDDEELEKKLGAQLRDATTSVVFLDNVRGKIDSPLLEMHTVAPKVNFRILGQSAIFSRPNTLLWLITSNNLAATEDLVDRCLPVRLHYEGNPRQRDLPSDPLAFARQERLRILAELVSMVVRWQQQGCPLGRQQHRCRSWAAVIGGILAANGLGAHFLANLGEAEAVMDDGLQALAAIADLAVRNHAELFATDGAVAEGGTATDLLPLFREAEALAPDLLHKPQRALATHIGQFLGAKLGRQVTVQLDDRIGCATLRARDGRGRTKSYYFHVVWDEAGVEPVPESSSASPVVVGGLHLKAEEPVDAANDLDWS